MNKEMIHSLVDKVIKVDRGGPETLEGIMDIVTDDFVTIVANEEIIRVSLFHIRNISYGVKIEKVKTDEGSNQKKDNNKSKDSK